MATQIFQCGKCKDFTRFDTFHLKLMNGDQRAGILYKGLKCSHCGSNALTAMGQGKDVIKVRYRNPKTNEIEESNEIAYKMRPHDRDKMRDTKSGWKKSLEDGLLGRSKKATKGGKGMRKDYD